MATMCDVRIGTWTIDVPTAAPSSYAGRCHPPRHDRERLARISSSSTPRDGSLGATAENGGNGSTAASSMTVVDDRYASVSQPSAVATALDAADRRSSGSMSMASRRVDGGTSVRSPDDGRSRGGRTAAASRSTPRAAWTAPGPTRSWSSRSSDGGRPCWPRTWSTARRFTRWPGRRRGARPRPLGARPGRRHRRLPRWRRPRRLQAALRRGARAVSAAEPDSSSPRWASPHRGHRSSGRMPRSSGFEAPRLRRLGARPHRMLLRARRKERECIGHLMSRPRRSTTEAHAWRTTNG